MEKYYGNYLGIVVSEDGGDPERRGRVQVWIPGITNTFYGGWNDEVKNKDVYYVGDDSELSDLYVKKLRSVLPWAECASPLIGGGTPLYYNETNSGSYQESVPVALEDTSTPENTPPNTTTNNLPDTPPNSNNSDINTSYVNPETGNIITVTPEMDL